MCLGKWATPTYDTVDPRNTGHMAKTQSSEFRVLHNTMLSFRGDHHPVRSPPPSWGLCRPFSYKISYKICLQTHQPNNIALCTRKDMMVPRGIECIKCSYIQAPLHFPCSTAQTVCRRCRKISTPCVLPQPPCENNGKSSDNETTPPVVLTSVLFTCTAKKTQTANPRPARPWRCIKVPY